MGVLQWGCSTFNSFLGCDAVLVPSKPNELYLSIPFWDATYIIIGEEINPATGRLSIPFWDATCKIHRQK